MEYRAYAVTIRPRNGVTDEHVKSVAKFVRFRSEYYVMVTEKTGHERHIHAGLFLKKPMRKNKLNEYLTNLICFKELGFDEKRVIRQGTKIMYNCDWVNEYLDKEDDTVIVMKNLPEEKHLEAYFPGEAEQQKAQRAARVNAAKDAYFQMLEELWYQQMPPGTEICFNTTKDFLADNMYNKRTIKVLRDLRHISNTANHLVRYLKKATKIACPDYDDKELRFEVVTGH